MWRGVTLGQPFLSGRAMLNAGSSNRRVVVYPISKVQEAQGRALINWVATLKTAADGTMPPQDWTYVARREEPLAAFASFDFEFLDVPALIRGADVVYQYPMLDRDPLPSWNFGRVTLLGDAAHPMHPVGGNGASQAIIDARVLARELALQRYMQPAYISHTTFTMPWITSHVTEVRRLLGDDWWPYGLEANRKVLDTFLSYHHAQGLSKRRYTPEDLFLPEVRAE